MVNIRVDLEVKLLQLNTTKFHIISLNHNRLELCSEKLIKLQSIVAKISQ